MKQLTYLDLLAKYGVGSAHPGGMLLTREALRVLPIGRNTRLLDVGCGTGQTSFYAAKTYSCKVTAMDINEQMLKQAALRFDKEALDIELVRADALALPFEPHSFDIVLSESVTAFTVMDRALKEYKRVLETGGILLAIEMTAETPLAANDAGHIMSVYGVSKIPTQNEWIDMFTQAGFSDIQAYRVNIRPTFKVTSPKMMYDFYPHLSTMNRYHRKLGYRVYICRA